MTIYAAFLRGINVGGKNVIKMADLKRQFETLGLLGVQTYIQSGNVLFKSPEDEVILRNKIEKGLKAAFGLPITVILRTSEELESILLNCPFSHEEITNAETHSGVESLYVSLLADVPSSDRMEILSQYRCDTDSYKISGREVYMLFWNSIRNSKLANNLYKLDVPSTVRNWKTMAKINALAKVM